MWQQHIASSHLQVRFFHSLSWPSDVKMEVACVLCAIYQDWKQETVGNASKRNANTLERCQQIYEHTVSKCHKSAID